MDEYGVTYFCFNCRKVESTRERQLEKEIFNLEALILNNSRAEQKKKKKKKKKIN